MDQSWKMARIHCDENTTRHGDYSPLDEFMNFKYGVQSDAGYSNLGQNYVMPSCDDCLPQMSFLPESYPWVNFGAEKFPVEMHTRTIESQVNLESKQPRYSFEENQVLVEVYYMLHFKEALSGLAFTDDDLKKLYTLQLQEKYPAGKFPPRDATALQRHIKSLKSRHCKDLVKYIDSSTEFGGILHNIVSWLERSFQARQVSPTVRPRKRRSSNSDGV